ncbi:MAG: gliding motility-associated ABC transporter ATP-binding subunit GldA [Bacteroidia bacterium]|nr:gliding motility-associated ABC transporter ATP-binding subunit GldA [Bacteroidia bacterium]
MSIKAEKITKLYGTQKALNAVTFEVPAGEVVGFLGPNGAGKSTMMKILTGFIPQTEGAASVCGFDVNEHSLEVRRMVGYLPESNPLYYDMYVREYLEFVAGIYKVPKMKSRVNEMIALTGLEPEKRKMIGALSKGYKQRVGLAQALIHDPKVLILDEPTSGLDPNQLSEIRNLIKGLGKEKTVMLSTHVMQEVEAMCSRVIIIRKGEIVADQATGSIKSGGVHQVITVEFDKEINKGAIKGINGVEEVNHIEGNTWQLTSRSGEDIRPDVFRFAVQHGLAVLTVRREEKKLEDVFKDLTR